MEPARSGTIEAMKHLLLVTLLAGCRAEQEAPSSRPVHTFSIVARDPETGELGVAVESHWFSVGPLVPWAEAGVGAVATQSFVNPAFGPDGLRLMGAGRSAADALEALVRADPRQAVRQVAFVDARGGVAAHTGARCIEWAGHHTGEGYSVQANMMLNDRVVPAMAKAFERASGPLAERLIAALEAGQAAGGDIRGQQSAALLVVAARASGEPWKDRTVDLRVEDHPRPVEELRRLYTVHRAYEHMNAGDAAMEEGDMRRALAEYASAAAIVPDNLEVAFWNAFTLATNGRVDDAVPILRRVFAEDENWVELLRRLPRAELIEEAAVARILERCGVQ